MGTIPIPQLGDLYYLCAASGGGGRMLMCVPAGDKRAFDGQGPTEGNIHQESDPRDVILDQV